MGDRPVVLVTGAAQGIGRATAAAFARRGHDVALVDRHAEGLASLAAELVPTGVQTLQLTGDLTDLAFAESTVRATAEHWGRLDVLVNSAAWRELVTMRRISEASWERTLKTCLTVPAFLSRWAAEVMVERGAGVIVNVSSLISRRGGGNSPAYAAAKGGLDALTYELAVLYGPHGIRVLAVNPGAVDTRLSHDLGDDETVGHVRAWSEDQIPLGRWASPDEVALTIVALAGPSASYVTGTTILVDGGWHHSHFPRTIRRVLDGE